MVFCGALHRLQNAVRPMRFGSFMFIETIRSVLYPILDCQPSRPVCTLFWKLIDFHALSDNRVHFSSAFNISVKPGHRLADLAAFCLRECNCDMCAISDMISQLPFKFIVTSRSIS